MKILFVSECYPDENNPQYCIYLEQQAKALIELGHTVDVMVPKIHGVNQAGMTEKEYNDIKVYNVLIKNGKLSKFIPIYKLKDTLKIFDWQKYDAVSLHIVSNGLCLRIANICKSKKVALVNHFHGLNVWKDYYTKKSLKHMIFHMYQYIIKRYHFNKMSAIVGVSNKVCERVTEKLKNKPVFTVYNGVDSERFTPKTEYNKNDVFTLLCVANLINIKGHDYLIEAVSRLKQQGKKVKLQLIGIGPEESRLKEKCNALDIGNDVEFLGTKNYDVVCVYMQKADMFIMPSYFEALGCVYLEAMSCGTLTCGCFGTGADEIIEDKVDGLLVEQKSTDDVYNAISFAMENPQKAEQIARKGVLKAELFSWENSAKSLVEVYKSFI